MTDGVFVQASPDSPPVFHALPAPTDLDIRDVAQATCERLCRYVLRGPVSNESLSRLPNGLVKLRLTHPWSDGTSHILLSPLDLHPSRCFGYSSY